MIDEAEQVVGSNIGGAKIGGDIDDAIVLFPDPMGATGGSLSTAIKMYKEKVPGTPRKIVCMNLIVTPEYLRRHDHRPPGRGALRDPARPRAVAGRGASTPRRARSGRRSAGSTTSSTSSPAAAASAS